MLHSARHAYSIPYSIFAGRLATVALPGGWPAIASLAQVVIAREPTILTVEAFSNVAIGLTDGVDSADDKRDGDLRIDAAVRHFDGFTARSDLRQ